MLTLGQYIMQRLLQYMESLGHSPHQICEQVNSDYLGIVNQSLSFNKDQLEEVWKTCIDMTGVHELGFHLGQYLSIESMGTFGMLLQNVPDIREALDVASNFTSLVSSFFQIKLSVDEDDFTVSLIPELAFQKQYPIRVKQGCLITFSLMIKMYAVLTMKKPKLNYIAMPPTVVDRNLMQFCFAGKMEFHPHNYILKCDSHILDLPIVNANDQLKPYIYEAANREMNSNSQQWTKQVNLILNQSQDEIPSLESVSKSLGMSARTLQRRLKKEETSFHDILVSFKLNLAKSLLNGQQPPKYIASRLGYDKVSSFYKSFKKWTGKTIQEYLKSERDKPI